MDFDLEKKVIEATEKLPTDEESRAMDELERWFRDKAYFGDNYQQFYMDFPNEYIAVLDQKVVAHDRDFMAVAEALNGSVLATAYIGGPVSYKEPPRRIVQAA